METPVQSKIDVSRFRRVLVAGATGVCNQYRNVTQIGAVSHCGFNPDFRGDTHNGKRVDARFAGQIGRGIHAVVNAAQV